MARKKRHLGFGFPDEVTKVNIKGSPYQKIISPDWIDSLLPNFDGSLKQSVNRSLWRTTLLSVCCLMVFFIISLRLFHLQIVQGEYSRELADGNRVQIRVIHAPRGVIFDRNNKVLAANAPAFRLIDPESKKVRLITREEAIELEVKNDPRSKDLEIDNVRTYPMGEKMAHLLGYVGEISEDQLKLLEFKNYQLGDRVGKAGIEAQYEKQLKGVDGGEIIEVDSLGRQIRTLRKIPPILGQNIYLSVDVDLQDKIYQLIEETLQSVGSCCGGAAVLDPQNGQVLALLSFPSFDPNILTQGRDESLISEIFTHADSPFLNRVIRGTYPPGSTFKIVSALAGLSSGKVSPETIFQDSGVIYLGTFKFTNWYFNQYGKTEGSINLIKAIKRSNDTYFYHVGQIIGEKYLADWAKKLLLGSKLGIDLPGEEMGLVPDNEWKVKTKGEVWYPGDTLHMAIGQGFVLTTPLQILGITSYVAADGKLFKPQLILSDFKPKVILANLTDPSWVQLVKQGLTEVPNPGGTAWPFFTFPISTGGKTGTAEYGDPKNRTHAWYTSFAPSDDPKIAMTVLIEGGGEGSSVAAPIVKEVYRWYFSPDKNKLIQDVYTQATDSGRILGE